MQLEDADVLLAGSLLGFDQPGSSVNAHNKTSRDFGIERSRMASLLDSQDSFDPGHHLVGARIGWFVQINATTMQILFNWPLQWRTATRQRCIVIGTRIQLVKVLPTTSI